MSEAILLIIGILIVIIGAYLLFREEKSKLSYKDAEHVFKAMTNFENKVNSSLDLIDEKTNESLEKIEKTAWEYTSKQQEGEDRSKQPLTNLKSKHIKVYNLYKQGLTCKEIAGKLKKGVGEIETIVSLLNLERE